MFSIPDLNDILLFGAKQNNLVYKLDSNENVVAVLKCKKGTNVDRISIPRSITKSNLSSYARLVMMELQNDQNDEFIVKSIGDNFINGCDSITTIIFPENSEIESFGKFAFSNSFLMNITIPSKVKIIGKECFYNCRYLNKVNFAEKSELELIDADAFERSNIKSICIPANVKKICLNCFNFCSNLQIVTFEKNAEVEILESNSFSNTSIKTIIIPQKVKLIGKYCFYQCKELKEIEFSKNSELESICQGAFNKTSIKTIYIPPKVVFFESNYLKGKLDKIEFDDNSEIIKFPSICTKNIKIINIPSKIESFSSQWLDNSNSLNTVNISPKNKLLKYIDDQKKLLVLKDDTLVFASRDIKHAFIPSYIKRIGARCFSYSLIDVVDEYFLSQKQVLMLLQPSKCLISLKLNIYYNW